MAKHTVKPFDRDKKPVKQNIFLLPLIWLVCFIITGMNRLKIRKTGMKGIKPPYLLLSTHHSFMDFYVTPRVLFPHRANYISELEGFEGKEWLYRQIGCLCKRKYTNDIKLIRNIQHVVHKNNNIIVIYPEARYSHVGVNSKLPHSVSKLIKLLKVPVVMLNMKGNYLRSPIWNISKRKVPLEADLVKLFTAEETQTMSLQEISDTIDEKFVYDEYKWQKENKIQIPYKKRAEGLHKPLYLCPNCGAENRMHTKDSMIYCKSCTKEWDMSVYGELAAVNGDTEFAHIPDWYEYQRTQVRNEIINGAYKVSMPVRIEALPNADGFIKLGEGLVTHDKGGFRFCFKEDGENKSLCITPIQMTSLHTEYNYRNKWGECITLSTLDNTYFLYPLSDKISVTKLQLATEELYLLAKYNKLNNVKTAVNSL